MTLEEFKKEKIQAMKAKDSDAINALNLVINKIMLTTIEKRSKNEEITDADIVSILQKSQKELEEERDAFEKANRTDTVVSLNKQIETVKKYLPKLLTVDEIKEIISKLEDKSMPFVMKYFKANYAGKCDMKDVNNVIKSL